MTRYVFEQTIARAERGAHIDDWQQAAREDSFVEELVEVREEVLSEVRDSIRENVTPRPQESTVDTCMDFLEVLIDMVVAGGRLPASRSDLESLHPNPPASGTLTNLRLDSLIQACARANWADRGLPALRVFKCKREGDLDKEKTANWYFVGLMPANGDAPADSGAQSGKKSEPDPRPGSAPDPDALPEPQSALTPGPVPPPPPASELELAARKLKRSSTLALSAALVALAIVVCIAGFVCLDGPRGPGTVVVSPAPLVEKTLSIHATARGKASVVVGSSQSNLEHWRATIASPGAAHYAHWPRDPQREPEFYAVATQPKGADGPGELRVYDLRAPTPAGSEPERILQDMLAGERFKPTPERVPGIGQPEAYGFFDITFADLGDDLPTLIALAHDHNMAPTWVISYSLETGQPTAEIFHPGHLEHVAVNDTADRPFALIAGVNNRILCPDSDFEDCPLHVAPVALALDLPFDDKDGYQFIPGLGTTPEGQQLPVLHPWRYWQIDQDHFRFIFVQRTSDGTGNLKIQARDGRKLPEGQVPCWKFWHVDGSAEIVDDYEPGLGDGAACREPAPEMVEVEWGEGR